MAIVRTNTFVELATTNLSTVTQGDIITGQTSGAVGLVIAISNVNTPETGTARASGNATRIRLKSSPANNIGANGIVRITSGPLAGDIRRIISWDNTNRYAGVTPNFSGIPGTSDIYSVEDRLTVAVLSGTFVAETVRSQASVDVVVSQVSSGASLPSNTYIPNNVVIVDGDNSASDDIFRDIRDASNAGGWALHTDPSATSHFLGLDAQIWFGRRDQTATTKILSKNELPYTRANAFNFVYAVNNSSYNTEITFGSITGEKQPANGNILDIIGYQELDTVKIRFYDTSFKNLGTAYADGNMTLRSDMIIKRCETIKVGYANFSNFLTSYVEDCLFQCSPVIASGFLNFTNTRFVVNDWTVFISADHSEAVIEDVEFLTKEDETPSGYFGMLFSNTYKHLRGCTYKSNAVFALAAVGMLANEKYFRIRAIDEQGNPLENSCISLLDKFGYSALFNDTTARINTYANATATSLDLDDYTLVSDGDVIRINDEKILVTDASANPIIVQRAYQGTTARAIPVGRFVWKQESCVFTDSDGYSPVRWITSSVNYSDDTNYNDITYYGPFEIEIVGSGFKTIKNKVLIGSTDNLSYKVERFDEQYEMKQIDFIEQRSYKN